MALKEGRCVNCGSILLLDPEQDKAHCLYCDAVFASTEAFEIAEHPEDYTFPNEKQPEYTGPDLDPKGFQSKIDTEAFARKVEANQNKQELTPEKPHLSQAKVPDLHANRKQILLTLSVIAAIVIVFLAFALPLSAKRNRVRQALSAKLYADYDLPGDYGEKLLISGMTNDDVVLAFEEKPDPDYAEKIFRDYCQTRAKLMDMEGSDAMYEGVSFDFISADGSFRLETAKGSHQIKLIELD